MTDTINEIIPALIVPPGQEMISQEECFGDMMFWTEDHIFGIHQDMSEHDKIIASAVGEQAWRWEWERYHPLEDAIARLDWGRGLNHSFCMDVYCEVSRKMRTSGEQVHLWRKLGEVAK